MAKAVQVIVTRSVDALVFFAAILTGSFAAGCNDRSVLDSDVDADMRPQEDGVLYAFCESSDECVGNYCVHPPGESGYCSQLCMDPDADCAPLSPAPTDCVAIGQPSEDLCALDCSDDPCPDDMRCEAVLTNEGERRLCF